MNFLETYSILENLDEAVKVVSDPDALFHYTTPLPFCRILKDNVLKAGVNGDAVCFTTDDQYRIYGYTCGFQFSRKKLVAAGYELEDYNDALAYDPDWEEENSESEERVYKDVTNLRSLLTAVHIHWSPEGMTQDQAPDTTEYSFIEVAQTAKGDKIGDEDYRTGKPLVWKISMSYFRKLLQELQSKGIKVYEYGTPMNGIYWLDETGKLHDGKMPEPTAKPAEIPA